jgi:hypothetical protein
MDMAQAFVFDVGWAFFAAWGMVLAAVSIVAFGRDIFPFTQQSTREQEHRR